MSCVLPLNFIIIQYKYSLPRAVENLRDDFDDIINGEKNAITYSIYESPKRLERMTLTLSFSTISCLKCNILWQNIVHEYF